MLTQTLRVKDTQYFMTLGVGCPNALLLILEWVQQSSTDNLYQWNSAYHFVRVFFSCNSRNFVWSNIHSLCADVFHVEQWCHPSDPALRHVWLDRGETVLLDASLQDLAPSQANDTTHTAVTAQTVAMGTCQQPSAVVALEGVKKWQDRIMKSLKNWWWNILIRNSVLLPRCRTGNCQNLVRCLLLKGGRLVTGSPYHVDSEWS